LQIIGFHTVWVFLDLNGLVDVECRPLLWMMFPGSADRGSVASDFALGYRLGGDEDGSPLVTKSQCLNIAAMRPLLLACATNSSISSQYSGTVKRNGSTHIQSTN
jgi:hypothetical protein